MMMDIRLAQAGDAADIAAIYRPAVTDNATSFEIYPPDAAEMGRRMAAVMERTPWIVCEIEGRVAGFAYASPHRDRAAYSWSVEVSAYVRQDVHGRGIGRRLYASLFAILALQGFRNAYAGITLPNAASQALHRAVGFTEIGVFKRIGYKAGEWHDVEWLERAVAPHIMDPPVPTPLPLLLGAPALPEAMCVTP